MMPPEAGTGGPPYERLWPSGLRRREFTLAAAGRPELRLTAAVNPRILDRSGRPYGQLGSLELADDVAGAGALIEAAMGWLRADPDGPRTVLAPMNGDPWHAYRLRTEGFGLPDIPLEPASAPRLPGILEACGFRVMATFVTKVIHEPAALAELWAPHHARALRSGYGFRPLAGAGSFEELTAAFRLASRVFADRPLFAPITEAEFRAIYGPLLALVPPELAICMTRPSGEPVGLCLGLPQVGDGTIVNLKTFGLIPSSRGAGLGPALAAEAYRRSLALGARKIRHALMAEGNEASSMDRGLGRVERRYALYARSLGDGGAP